MNKVQQTIRNASGTQTHGLSAVSVGSESPNREVLTGGGGGIAR